MTTMERLRAELVTLEEQIATLETQRRRVQLAVAEIEGDKLKAEWLRLQLAGEHDGAHQAWVRMMAARHPVAYLAEAARDHEAIRAEMERQQTEASHGA